MKNQSPQDFFKDYDVYCFHKDPKNGYALMTQDDYYQMNQYEAEHEAEQWAENAWLRKAEQGIDDGFDEWERSRGCY